MDSFSWIHLIYLIGVLLLIAPLAAHIFKAPYALRNAAVWLAIIAALGWAYKLSNGQFDQFINMPDNYQSAPATPSSVESETRYETPSNESGIVEDSPIRNP